MTVAQKAVELVVGDWITITWGRIVQQHVVVGISKHHVDTVKKEQYEWAIRQYGEYRTTLGYTSWPKRTNAPRLSIFEMISHKNGQKI